MSRFVFRFASRFLSVAALTVCVCVCVGATVAQTRSGGKSRGSDEAAAQAGQKKPAARPGRHTEAKKKTDTQQKLTSARAADTTTHKRPQPLSSKQQQSALAFARENHPELVRLIQQLKRKRPDEYHRALRDLHSAGERFGRMKQRMPADRYEQQLALWKLDSRIRLQLAKWSVSHDKKLEAEIRAAISERRNIQREQYEQDRARTVERLERLEKLLKQLASQDTDQEWQRLSRAVDRSARAARKAAANKSKKSTARQRDAAKKSADRNSPPKQSDKRNSSGRKAPAKKSGAGQKQSDQKSKKNTTDRESTKKSSDGS